VAASANDPSRVSTYVNDALYRRLITDFSGWQRDELLVRDAAQRDGFRQILEREARHLDSHAYDAWLGLFARECIYWVPATPGGGDPRREVAVTFDDRRRLEDRVFRLRTGYAWSQVPGSRTSRLIGNVELFATADPGFRMVRSNFLVTEFRDGETRSLAGWCVHRFARRDEAWEIAVKQVNLIECDQALRNPSIIL
jgi:benzoate/toluate 1,2-dioxygenase beta subunit